MCDSVTLKSDNEPYFSGGGDEADPSLRDATQASVLRGGAQHHITWFFSTVTDRGWYERCHSGRHTLRGVKYCSEA